ncbi:hypothetical protein VXQ18_04900 [Brucella abortus]|nr:hypothetical protein [Brucella abortus]
MPASGWRLHWLSPFAYAQDADLRGSISDDIAAAATDADDAGAGADSFYSPEQDNASSGKGDLSETPRQTPYPRIRLSARQYPRRRCSPG